MTHEDPVDTEAANSTLRPAYAAWSTIMRVHHALGDEPGVISVYSECRERFASLGAEPSGSTRRLLSDLRR